MPPASTDKDFGTPKRTRNKTGHGGSPNSPAASTPTSRGTPGSPGKNKTPVSGKGGLRASAPPFFMSGTNLEMVVPLAGYVPAVYPANYKFSPYNNYEPNQPGQGAKLPDFPVAPTTAAAKAEEKKEAPPEKKKEEKEEEPEEREEVSEEVWQRRLAKRQHEIEVVKSLSAYQNFLKKVPKIEDRSADDPMSPRCDDRYLAKRRWKSMLEDWRSHLRQKYDARVYHMTELLKARPAPTSEEGSATKYLKAMQVGK